MSDDNDNKTTHFGYSQVPVGEKAHKVAEVFSSVAGKYDVMNDLMSFGLHRLWKRFALTLAAVRPGQRVLDLAGGTGDLAAQLSRKVGPKGHVILADINNAMLNQGRDRLIDSGLTANINYVQANAERLPFTADYYDRVTMAFGLRNVTHKETALQAIHACLKPGGRLLVLEFSTPQTWLQPAYDFYSFKALPLLGKLIAKDADSYRYLAESIRMHPDQALLKDMMQTAGFERCEFFNLSAGIVALHRGYKL